MRNLFRALIISLVSCSNQTSDAVVMAMEVTQSVTCSGCWSPVEASVFAVGDPGAPSEQDMIGIIGVPPADYSDPATVADLLIVAQSTHDAIPASDLDEQSRPSGAIGCCYDHGKVMCWASIRGRTYFCEGTAIWQRCGSFAGAWL